MRVRDDSDGEVKSDKGVNAIAREPEAIVLPCASRGRLDDCFVESIKVDRE